MIYTKMFKHMALTVIYLLALCSLCSANEKTEKSKPLILNIETTTNFSQIETKQHLFKKTKRVETENTVTKKIKKARRIFKKATSFTYGKKQKIRFHPSKSSYLLTYTYTL